jgi:hypothetical protein
MSTKKRTIAWAMVFMGGVILTSCHPGQQIIPYEFSNPTLRAAPGASGGSREMAEEFLKYAPYPASDKTLMHEGLCYAEPYYQDPGLDPAGNDTDRYNGVDTATLFFSATHGTPETWLAMPNGRDPGKCPQSASETHVVEPGRMRLGNGQGAGDGQDIGNGLRYFWQCASNVFAHGPRQCPGGAPDFGCPESSEGSQDTVHIRNVYERWGGLLAPGLRMVCGFSTAAFCHPDDARRVWDLYDRSSNSLAAADAFIEGFRREREGTLPLCITLGGSSVERTPLFDERLFTSPNPSGASHYHAQYPVPFRSTHQPGRPAETGSPLWAPIFGLKHMPLPATLKKLAFERQDGMLVSSDLVNATGISVRVRPASGAVYLNGEIKFDPDDRALAEDQYLDRAARFLREWGLVEAGAKPEGVRMMLETVPVSNRTFEAVRRQKSVFITFRRQVDLDGKSTPVLGDGGVIRIQLNSDGSVARAAKIWREITGVRKIARIKPYETTYGEALQQLADPASYRLDGWTWGYKEFEGSAEQAELRIVHIFYFIPKGQGSALQVAPVRVEIVAQLDMSEATIDR